MRRDVLFLQSGGAAIKLYAKLTTTKTERFRLVAFGVANSSGVGIERERDGTPYLQVLRLRE